MNYIWTFNARNDKVHRICLMINIKMPHINNSVIYNVLVSLELMQVASLINHFPYQRFDFEIWVPYYTYVLNATAVKDLELLPVWCKYLKRKHSLIFNIERHFVSLNNILHIALGKKFELLITFSHYPFIANFQNRW